MKKNSDQHFYKRIFRKTGQAINDYNLIADHDKVMVGLSGGKDSLALLDILAGRRKYSRQTFTLEAIHIKIKAIPYQVDISYLDDFCRERDVQFHYVETDAEINDAEEKNPCFICSWNRRKRLFEEIQQRGFTKLAFGHHMNDAVETLLMNMMFQGSISSMPPKLPMFDGKIEIIRPLILLAENEIAKYAEIKGFQKLLRDCPYERDSRRDMIKQLINNLQDKDPHVCGNIFASMSNIQKEYLPPNLD